MYILSGHAAHSWPQGPLSEPQDIGEHPINVTISPDTFEKWVISCCGSPRFLSRLNLQLHPVSSTSKEATLHIHDHRGPYQSPKMIQRDVLLLSLACVSLTTSSHHFFKALQIRGKEMVTTGRLVGQWLEIVTVTNRLVFEEIYLLWKCF